MPFPGKILFCERKPLRAHRHIVVIELDHKSFLSAMVLAERATLASSRDSVVIIAYF